MALAQAQAVAAAVPAFSLDADDLADAADMDTGLTQEAAHMDLGGGEPRQAGPMGEGPLGLPAPLQAIGARGKAGGPAGRLPLPDSMLAACWNDWTEDATEANLEHIQAQGVTSGTRDSAVG